MSAKRKIRMVIDLAITMLLPVGRIMHITEGLLFSTWLLCIVAVFVAIYGWQKGFLKFQRGKIFCLGRKEY